MASEQETRFKLDESELASLRVAEEINHQTVKLYDFYMEGYQSGFRDALSRVRQLLKAQSQQVLNNAGSRIGKDSIGGIPDLESGELVVDNKNKEKYTVNRAESKGADNGQL